MTGESRQHLLHSASEAVINAFAKYYQPQQQQEIQQQQSVLQATWDTNVNGSSGFWPNIGYNYSSATAYIYGGIVAGTRMGPALTDSGGGDSSASIGDGVDFGDLQDSYSSNYSLIPLGPTGDGLQGSPATNLPAESVFAFITYGILLTSIGAAGLMGNALSIVVLSSPKMKSSINCCLIALAIFDIVVILSSTLLFGIQNLCHYTSACPVYDDLVYPYMVPFVYPMGLIAQTGSVWVTVTVTMERYVAVCLPLRARSLCTYGRARIYVVGITVFSIVYNLPRFLEAERFEYEDADTKEIKQSVRPSWLREDKRYVDIYITWLYLFVLYFIPFVMLAVLNGIIWLKVRTANRERQRLSRLQQKEMGLAIMLFCVVVVFFICNLLALMVNILEMNGIIIDELTASSNLLVTINSSVNFVIYCIFGQKFRRILLRTICSCCPTSLVGRRLVERGGELDESTYPVSSVNTTETKSLMHYNGNGAGGGHLGSRSGRHLGARHASLSTTTTTTLFDHVAVANKKHNNSSCTSMLTRSSSELGDVSFKMALSVSASPCTGSLRIVHPPHGFRLSSYNMLNFRSSSKLETPY